MTLEEELRAAQKGELPTSTIEETTTKKDDDNGENGSKRLDDDRGSDSRTENERGTSTGLELQPEQPERSDEQRHEGGQGQGLDPHDKDLQGSGQLEEKKPQTVPLAKFLEERERRKSTETERETLKQQIAFFQGLTAKNEPAPPPPPQVPDAKLDPDGYRDYWLGQTIETQKRQAQKISEFEQKEYLHQSSNQMKQVYPDFEQAFQHFANIKEQEFRSVGFSNPQEIQNLIANDIATKVNISRQVNPNGNPLASIYAAAKAYGYAAPTAAASSNIEKEKEAFRKQASDMQVNKTLGNGSGVSTSSTTKSIKDMPLEKQLRMAQKLDDDQLDELLSI